MKFLDLKIGQKFKLFYHVDPISLIKTSANTADYSKFYDAETKSILGSPDMSRDPRVIQVMDPPITPPPSDDDINEQLRQLGIEDGDEDIEFADTQYS